MISLTLSCWIGIKCNCQFLERDEKGQYATLLCMPMSRENGDDNPYDFDAFWWIMPYSPLNANVSFHKDGTKTFKLEEDRKYRVFKQYGNIIAMTRVLNKSSGLIEQNEVTGKELEFKLKDYAKHAKQNPDLLT